MDHAIRLLFALLLLSVAAPQPRADASHRAGTWQVSLNPMYAKSALIRFDGGAEADLNARSSFGFGFGYNLNEQWELGLDMGSGSAGYTGTRIGESGTRERFSASYYISYFNLGASFNLLKSRLTPFVSGNLGWSYIDSGIPTGDVGEICWWDPWWGWICGPYARTYTDTKWHYGADLGLRFDVTRAVFLKGAIGQTWIDFDNAGDTTFTNYRLSLGFMF